MTTYLSQGIAAAAVLAALMSMASMAPVAADEPAQLAAPAAKPDAAAVPDNPAENALRRGAPGPTRAADRAHCRDLAAKRKLFGLGRHKFLQRCRRARRKAAPHPR